MMLVAAAVAVSVLGCGPGIYTARLWPAQRAVERARDAGAESRAPYLYWYAVAHLDKAQEEAGESSYQRAARYAGRAREAAEAAEAVARRAQDAEATEAVTGVSEAYP